MNKKRVLVSDRVVVSDGIEPAGVVIENGKISDVIAPEDLPKDAHVEDHGNNIIMPGIIDAHVHINEPGRTDWEGFETATRSAAAGGITTLADMPLNSSPVTTTTDALEEKKKSADGKCAVNCCFYAGLIPGNEKEIELLLDAGVAGVKAFLCHSGLDEFPNVTENELRQVMPLLAEKKKPLLVHAELADNDIPEIQDSRSYRDYLATRPQRWEVRAIELLIRLCRQTGCPVHIVHLSAGEAISVLQAARDEGLPISVETAPHYLYYSADEITDGDTRFKCAPPIREYQNRDQLWSALSEGVVDLIATDHSPCPPKLKEGDSGDFTKAWGGISSLQLLLPVVWTEARRRGFSAIDVARWLSQKPAQLLGLEGSKGKIAPGYDADMCVWNPAGLTTVDEEMIRHRHKITPYIKESLFGVVQQTWLGGEKIFTEGEIKSWNKGKILRS